MDVDLRCGASPALEPLKSCLVWRSQLLVVLRYFGSGEGGEEDFLCSPLTPEGRPSPLTSPSKSTDVRTTVISDSTEESERRVVQTSLLILCRT